MIIYTAMETSDRLRLPWLVRPLLDALLALTIDLSMDAVAIRLGFWPWGAYGAWFCVPLRNFYGWFCVVLSFSLLLRLGRRWLPPWRHVWLGGLGVPLLAVPLSVVALMQYLRLYEWLLSRGISPWLIVGGLLVLSAAAPLSFVRSSHRDNPLDGVILAVPLFHLYFPSALVWAGIVRQVPLLIVIAVMMFLVSLLLHLWPSWRRLPATARAPAFDQLPGAGS